jgi:CRP-like cAMP-binding protein
MADADAKAVLTKHARDFAKGTVLFREGEPGNEMFVIQSGRVAISKMVRDVEKVLVTIGAGEFFGEMSILNNKPRSATATVVDDARLLVIEPKTFETMVRSNAEIAVRLIKTLAARLQEADEQIENLLLHDPQSRVVHFILRQAESKGHEAQGGVLVHLLMQELPQRLGLKPDLVNEATSKLLKTKLVSLSPDGVLVSDTKKLQQYLEFLEMKEKFGG